MTTAVDALTLAIGEWGGTPSGEYDSDGVHWTFGDITGWFDGPPSRTNFTDRPHHDGSFDAPEYAGARVVTAGGRIAVDDPAQLPALEKARQRTQALLRHGKGTLRVDGRGESLQALVRRSDKPTCDAVGGLAYDFSVQLTAPDPIRYGTTIRRAGVDLGAPVPSGLDFGHPTTTQALSNAGFEDASTAPWRASYCTLERSTAQVHGGTASGKVTPDGNTPTCWVTSGEANVYPGATIEVTAWVYLVESVGFSLSVQWVRGDSTGIVGTSDHPATVTPGAWTQVTATFTVPDLAGFVQLQPTLTGSPPASSVMYLDDASVVVPSTAGGLDFSGGGLDFGGGAPDTLMYLGNDGTANTLPTFTFTRPVNQPVLSNPDNGGRLEYLGNVMSGQQLAIDCKAKTVLLNGISRRTVMGRADFGAFAVPHQGVLRVTFGTLDVAVAGAHVDAAWTDGYW